MKKVLLVIALILFSSQAFAVNLDGRKTVTSAGTAEALGTGTFNFIDICAETDNTGVMSVGFSPIASLSTRTGLPLNAGDCWHYDPQDQFGNLAKIFIDATVSTDGVTYTAYD